MEWGRQGRAFKLESEVVGRQDEAKCLKMTTEGDSTGGQAGPGAEHHRTGFPASNGHLSECFYLQVQVRVVNTARMNSWEEI